MYQFVLKFALPDQNADPAQYMDALFEAGCDDATVGVGKRGSIGLDFSRDGKDAEDAVRSAITAVQKAIPDAKLLEIQPDLVNLADVADLIGCTRQNIRKYATGEIRAVAAGFPNPIHSGATNLWHLYEIVSWMVKYTELKPNRNIIDVARVSASINLQLQQDRLIHAE